MTEMIKISLPDGSVRDVAAGTTPADIAAAIGPGLAKAALAARVNGEVRDIGRPIEESDAELAILTSRDEADALELVRHDYAHLLAEAAQNLFPGTQITFGPATDDGFYYDFAPPPGRGPFTEEDLPAIEEEMRRLIRADKPLVREVWTRDRLIDWFERHGETFKAEWATELPRRRAMTIYRSGEDWLDMCRGPHLASTGKLDPDAFKLTRVSGAYWRGDQKNPMLSRIYGTGWLNQEAARGAPDAARGSGQARPSQDRRRDGPVPPPARGARLGLLASEGLHHLAPARGLYAPQLDAAGYEEVKTPQLMDARQWEQSGHWGKYRENMFVVPDEIPGTEEGEPVLCPARPS